MAKVRHSAGGRTGARRAAGPLKTYLRQQEQAHLNRAIRQSDGDEEQAALLHGISRATLYRCLAEEEGAVTEHCQSFLLSLPGESSIMPAGRRVCGRQVTDSLIGTKDLCH